MNVGDKVQFIRDVTEFDLYSFDENDTKIVVPIWTVGTVVNIPKNTRMDMWVEIDPHIEGVFDAFGYPPDCYELILPTQQ